MLIEMNKKEKVLWNQIEDYWKNVKQSNYSDMRDSDEIGKKQRILTNSLLKRKAIPLHRFKWIDDPKFNIGSKNSRLSIFCKNFGANDDRIFEHPHWYLMGFLPFLVGVISLPEQLVERFRKDAENKMNNGYDIGMIYRGLARSHGLTKNSSEEFHKLALDCGYSASESRTIRDIIRNHLR